MRHRLPDLRRGLADVRRFTQRGLGALALTCAGAALAAVALGGAAAAERPFKAPRTSDGQPDLQGYWTNNTVVPLQRPAAYADRTNLTEAEARDRLDKALAPAETEAGTDADVHYDLADYGLDITQRKMNLDTRTSMIVDPADGKLPALLPEAAARAKERADYTRAHAFDSAQMLGLSVRCIVWPHEGPPIMPTGYNSNLEIYQSPGYVTIITEMMPDPRIVPLDARPHLPSGVKQWLGDSRGHYQGNTLVIETTNYTGRTQVSGTPAGLLLTPDAHVTERIERTGADTLRYRFTVEDKNLWDRSWTAEYPLVRIDGMRFEYACQEGNYGLANTLSGARAKEREAAAQGTTVRDPVPPPRR
jgi:hypothetical protein